MAENTITILTTYVQGTHLELRCSEFKRRLRILLAEFGANEGALITVEEKA